MSDQEMLNVNIDINQHRLQEANTQETLTILMCLSLEGIIKPDTYQCLSGQVASISQYLYEIGTPPAK